MRDEHSFLKRWSRRKRASAIAAPAAPPAAPPPELPPVDGLTFESDFEAFMHAKVDERVRRMALKKLFSDPRFNVMDGLDTYIDDYSVEDPIPATMLEHLEHARATLLAPVAEEPAGTAPERPASNAPAPSANTDMSPSQ